MNDISVNYITLFTLFSCLAVLLFDFDVKVKLLTFSSLFGTYAVGGEINVLPGPIVCMFFMLSIFLYILSKRELIVSSMPHVNLFFILLVYGIAITIVIPYVFSEKIQVIKPNYIPEDGLRGSIPLYFSISNLSQIIYFAFDFFIVCILIVYRKRFGNAIQDKFISFNVHVASLLALMVIIEFILCMLGFDADFFSWFMGPSFIEPRPDRYALIDAIGLPIRRAQGIMGEPSFYSTYMAGVYGIILFLIRRQPSVKLFFNLILIASSLMLAFSTTAFFSFLLITVAVFFIPINNGMYRKKKKTLDKLVMMVAVSIFLVLFLYFVFSSDLIFDYLFGKLGNTQGYEAGNYSSGAERLYWDFIAFNAVVDSYGLGIGAGSTRASSFLLNFSAAFGCFGLFLLVVLICILLRSLYSSKYIVDYSTKLSRVLFLCWLVGFFISVPDAFNFFYLWIGLGMAMPLTSFSDEKIITNVLYRD